MGGKLPPPRLTRVGGPSPAAGRPAARKPNAASTGPSLEPARLPTAPRIDRDRGADHSAEQARLSAEALVGQAHVGPSDLRAHGEVFAARHVYARMARPGSDRAQEVENLVALLRGMNEPRRARRILQQLFEVGRFIEIYPLEIFGGLVEQYPDYLPKARAERFVRNRSFLETRMFDVGVAVRLEVPLGATVWGFALEGGGMPGYCFAPGPPGQFELEFESEGRFSVLLAGRLRGVDLVDRIHLWVEDAPKSPT